MLVASCFSKLVLHPLAGAALVLLSLRAGLLPADMDPAIPLVMMIVWATPTAVLVHALATMMQVGWEGLRGRAGLLHPRVACAGTHVIAVGGEQ